MLLNYRELKKEGSVLNVLKNLDNKYYPKGYVVSPELLKKVAVENGFVNEYDRIIMANKGGFGKVVIK